MPTLAIFICYSFGSPSHSNKRRKRNKRNPDWKRKTKTLFADDMILYIENPKDTTRKLLELTMNIVKLQDIKLAQRNPLHSYRLTIRKQNKKLREQFHSPLQ